MNDTINIFKSTTGLNNKIDPVRLTFDPKTGITDLSIAYNINIDKTGRISRRDGYTAQVSGNYHSLFSCGEYGLCVSGTDLLVIEPDYSTTSIATVTQNVRIAYVQNFDTIYYCNGYQKGIVTDRIHSAWTSSTYVGPDTTKTVSDPPIGHLLELFNGRMYIAQNDVIWHSNSFAYNQYDLARNYIPMGSRVKMIASVREGLWISLSDQVIFLHGTSPLDFKYVKMLEYPVIEGSAVKVRGSLIDPQIQGMCVIMTTTKGIFAGLPTGELYDLSRDRLSYPEALYSAAIVRDNRYTVSLQI